MVHITHEEPHFWQYIVERIKRVSRVWILVMLLAMGTSRKFLNYTVSVFSSTERRAISTFLKVDRRVKIKCTDQ